jgi:Ca2+-binding EF-hand superfamily protein
MVEKAFNLLDKDRSGYITVSDIANIYDPSANKEFQDGTKTKI